MPLKIHTDFAESCVEILKQDNRICGIAAGGSWIDDNMDEYSDIDFVIVVEAEDFPNVMKERKEIAEKLGDLLASFTGEHVGEPRLIVCLYDNPLLHVDLKFVALPDISERIENPVILWEKDDLLSKTLTKSQASFPLPDMQWIEDRFWIWTHYLATKIGRGELFELIEGISFIRVSVLGPLVKVRNGQLPRGMRYIEKEAADEVPRFLDTLAKHNKKDCIKALESAVQFYIELRDDIDNKDITKNTKAETAALQYFNQIKQENL